MERELDLYLASASPRRKELLARIGVQFVVLKVAVDEIPLPRESPIEHVTRLALAKAQAGWDSAARNQDLPVLGADTIVVVDEVIFGKPKDQAEAIAMLEALSGRTNTVFSAIAMVKGVKSATKLSQSKVQFRPLTAAEIHLYWDTGEPQDKAGAYAIQGRAAMFISHLSGSYTGVVGLPLFETAELLRVPL